MDQPRVTRPVTGDTDVTDREGVSPFDIADRVETLTDVIATANRASLRLQAEVSALRYAAVFAAVFAATLYILRGRS